jgi:5-methylcytosine-specific restriction protein A
MTPDQDIAFTEFLYAKSQEAEALGYPPSYFRRMLGTMGGAATARELLAKGKPSEGFVRLFELGRLDLTLEALVVETQWRELIDPVLVQMAERVLKQSGYPFKAYSALAAGTATVTAAVGPAPAGESTSPDALPAPRRPKNTLSFSAFCAFLGAPLANPADRWCGYNPAQGFAVFTIWADRLQGDQYVLWDSAARAGDTRIGAKELHKVLSQVVAAGHAAYGIRCEAKDATATTRERGYFDQDRLLVLQLEQRGADVLAAVAGTVMASDVAEGRRGHQQPFESAIDDIGARPPGNSSPERTAARAGWGFRRDDAVREHVIRRAGGKCEHCGKCGFEMPDGSFYLEAHHVIALSAQGPDTVFNVIALCPEHHREAHYGKQAESLEEAFLTKLREIEPPPSGPSPYAVRQQGKEATMYATDAKAYADHWEKESEQFDSKRVYAWLSAIAPTGKVLEVGVGVGRGTAALAAGRQVLGVDCNEHLVSKARERFAAGGIDSSIVMMDLLAPTSAGIEAIKAFAPEGIVAWLLGSSGQDLLKYVSDDVPINDKGKNYREQLEDAIMSNDICQASVQWVHFALRSHMLAEASDDEAKQAQGENYDEYVFHPKGFEVVDVQLLRWDRSGSDFSYTTAHGLNLAPGTLVPTIISVLARRKAG